MEDHPIATFICWTYGVDQLSGTKYLFDPGILRFWVGITRKDWNYCLHALEFGIVCFTNLFQPLVAVPLQVWTGRMGVEKFDLRKTSTHDKLILS